MQGWHVCRSELDVLSSLPIGLGCADAGSLFFASGQSGAGCSTCWRGTDSCPITECIENCNSTSCGPQCFQPTNPTARNDFWGCGGSLNSSYGILTHAGESCNVILICFYCNYASDAPKHKLAMWEQ